MEVAFLLKSETVNCCLDVCGSGHFRMPPSVSLGQGCTTYEQLWPELWLLTARFKTRLHAVA